MPAINVTNTRGVIVATINVGTTTGAAFPIEIQGQGISPYGAIYGDTVYHLLENFADDTEPTNPVEGMDFYNTLIGPHFYNGTNFVKYITAESAGAGLFNMLPSSQNIDLTAAGTTALFTAPGDGTVWLPTLLVLIPQSVNTVTVPAQIGLEVAASEDVLENTIVDNSALNAAHQFNIQGTTRWAEGVETISLDVAIAATATALTVDAYLFGFNGTP